MALTYVRTAHGDRRHTTLIFGGELTEVVLVTKADGTVRVVFQDGQILPMTADEVAALAA